MKVEGDLRAEKATFADVEKGANFDSIKVSETVFFYHTKFAGPFTLSGSVMDELECAPDGPERKPTVFGNNANFYNIRVTGNANLPYAEFAGSANFEGIDIGKNLEMTEAQFKNPSGIIKFDSMKVAGNAIFNGSTFMSGFDMSNAKVDGTLAFNKTQTNNCRAAKTLFGVKVDIADFDQACLAAPYNLQGVEYRLLNPNMGYRETKKLIEESVYSPSAYANLETYYRRVGLVNEADNVYIAGKDRERNETDNYFIWLSDWLLLVTVRYGKWPWLALVWSFVLIAIGRYLAFRSGKMKRQLPKEKILYWPKNAKPWSPAKGETSLANGITPTNNAAEGEAHEETLETGGHSLPRWKRCRDRINVLLAPLIVLLVPRWKRCWDRIKRFLDVGPFADDLKGYNPWWYSIALFLPIVELEDAKKWTLKPEKKFARHYMRVHIILGYLLIPIGLAAWTGLIK